MKIQQDLGELADALLRRSLDLEWVEVGGEAIIWHLEQLELHRLDPIGTLVFQLCDGVTPLTVTVGELGEWFGHRRQVAEDVRKLVTTLLGVGVLERVV